MATQLYNKTTGVQIYPVIDSSSIPSMAVTAVKIANGAIQSSHISPGAVTSSALDDGAVTTSKIVDSAITTAKINDGAVTNAKIANNAITHEKINDLEIITPKIGDGAVTASKIGAGSIDSSHINFKRYTANDLLTEYAPTLTDMLDLLSSVRLKIHWFFGVYSGGYMGFIPYMVDGSSALYVQDWDDNNGKMIWLKLANDTDYQNWLITAHPYLQFIA